LPSLQANQGIGSATFLLSVNASFAFGTTSNNGWASRPTTKPMEWPLY
jgi:hypothetical protein